MKKLRPLLLAVISFQSVHSQEVQHAPTVEQCRADQRLWFSRLEDEGSVKDVGYKELRSWGIEMGDCERVDPDFYIRYSNTGAEIAYAILMRLEHFLYRHNLRYQFYAEDAQGKR